MWLNPQRWPLRLLPVELTLLPQNLPVQLNQTRARIEVDKDPQVFLYYMDNRTYFQEPDGFWVAPGTTDIVIRTEHPLSVLDLRVRSPIPNAVQVSIGGRSSVISLQPDREQTVQLRPDPGVYSSESYQVVLTLTTSEGFYPADLDRNSTDTRHLGVFITPTYQVQPRPRP